MSLVKIGLRRSRTSQGDRRQPPEAMDDENSLVESFSSGGILDLDNVNSGSIEYSSAGGSRSSSRLTGTGESRDDNDATSMISTPAASSCMSSRDGNGSISSSALRREIQDAIRDPDWVEGAIQDQKSKMARESLHIVNPPKPPRDRSRTKGSKSSRGTTSIGSPGRSRSSRPGSITTRSKQSNASTERHSLFSSSQLASLNSANRTGRKSKHQQNFDVMSMSEVSCDTEIRSKGTTTVDLGPVVSPGLSGELFKSLKQSSKIIENLKRENAQLKTEKMEAVEMAARSDQLLNEVRQEVSQAQDKNEKARKEKIEFQKKLNNLMEEKEAAEEEARKCDRLLEIAYEGLRVANPKVVENVKLKSEKETARREQVAAEKKMLKVNALLKEAYKQLEKQTAKYKKLEKSKRKSEQEKEIIKLKKELDAQRAKAKQTEAYFDGDQNLQEVVRQLILEKEIAVKTARECEEKYEELEKTAREEKKRLLKAHGKLLAEKEVADQKVEKCKELLNEAYEGLKKAKVSSKQKTMLKDQRNRLNEELKEAAAKAQKYEVLLHQVFGDMEGQKSNRKSVTFEKPPKKMVSNTAVDDALFNMMPNAEKPFYFF